MKTKRIWMWSLIFGIFTTLIVYVGVFSDITKASTSETEKVEKKEETKEETKETATEEEKEETIKPREKNNPMLEISEGNRAISLKVSLEEGVSGYVEPGSYVDVIAFGSSKDDATKKEYRSAFIMFQNKKVLTSGKAPDIEEEAMHYETITLEVTPQEAVKLALATEDQGGLYFTLRNAEDHEVLPEPIQETREVIKEDKAE